MLTLLTTANFPDVMLPAYQANYFSMLFFVTYLLLGLYFLINLLVASVFNKYKGRLADKITQNHHLRRDQVEKVYRMFDTTQQGYLTPEQFKRFVEFVFDLNLRTREGLDRYRIILARLDKTEYDVVL